MCGIEVTLYSSTLLKTVMYSSTTCRLCLIADVGNKYLHITILKALNLHVDLAAYKFEYIHILDNKDNTII